MWSIEETVGLLGVERLASRETDMRNSTRKKILLAVIVVAALIALRLFGLLRDVTPVAY